MKAILSKLSVRLLFRNLKLFTVESCTGGGIGKAITDLPGSSAWYEGGLVTYSNEAKTQLAKVPGNMIERYGAVSSEVANAMASGAINYFPDAVSIAVTGIAGPDGGTKEKPVGLVWIACRFKNEIKSRQYNFSGSRKEIRRQTIEQAANLLMTMKLEK